MVAMFTRWTALALSIVAAIAVPGQAAGPPAVVAWQVYPTAIELRQHRQPHSLQVLGTTSDGYSIDLHSQARFNSADPRVATVDAQGWVRPVSNGATQVTISCGGQVKTVAVKVSLPAAEKPYSFRHEVMPVLTKGGCNAGACHGYSLGKNGFRLSLRCQGPEQDYESITREFLGRRVNFQAPHRSLLLAKARGDVPHEGGTRFGRGSLMNEILTKWIRQGVPGDLADKAEVVGVRLTPDKLVLRPGQKHRLQLVAEYSDGSKRDVTRLGVFTANNAQYADVDDEGLVVAQTAGETAIVGRFERTFAATSVTVLTARENFVPTPVPQDHLIDRHVVEKLNRLKVTPSGLATDEEFLRRIYLDLIGVQPKPAEVRAFLENKDPKKREKVADVLFERAEFVDHWSLKWGDLLQNSRNSVSSPSVYQFREFIRGAVASNMGLDEFARKLLTARGGINDDPASVYFAISKDTNDTVERVTQVFCGVRMLCARCHAHPLENWTQADYFGLASFFSQVSLRQDSRFPTVQNTKMVQLNLMASIAVNPRSGRPQPPKFLGGEEPKLLPGKDRREAYADWLTSPKNPFFARGIVNRVWSYFFHRG